MSRIVNIADLPNLHTMKGENQAAADSSRVTTKMVFGRDASLAICECVPGYHPAPHVHDSEQIVYIAEGELWIYLGGTPYHLRQGDFIRIPRMTMHWMWNRFDVPCVFYESNCPALIGNAEIRNSRCGLFDDGEQRPQGSYPTVIWLAEQYALEAERSDTKPAESGLLVRAADLATSVHSGAIGAKASGKLSSKCVHGLQHSLMIATRQGGYHSRPHVHDCEQINFLVKGEMWGFMSDYGYHRFSGDFNVVPRNMPHWAWLPTDDETVLLEVHSPVLGSAANRRALLTEEERSHPIRTVRNMTPWGVEEIMKVEEQQKRNPRLSHQ